MIQSRYQPEAHAGADGQPANPCAASTQQMSEASLRDPSGAEPHREPQNAFDIVLRDAVSTPDSGAASEELSVQAMEHHPRPPEHLQLAQLAKDPVQLAKNPGSGLSGDPRLPPVAHRPEEQRRPSGASALGQSLFFLFAMAAMLAAARFVMPGIVEEARYAWHRGELRAQYEASGDGLKNVSLGALSDAYQMVTQHVGPSVVHIEVQRDAESSREIARLLSASQRESYIPLADQGSGVVVDADGYVLTNYHVIAEGNRIVVGLSDGRRAAATVVGVDALTDLALLKVDADRLFPIQWGDSDRSQVGSPVWAVGSPFGLDRTVTFGILSGKHRVVKASTRYQDFMQSDAAINPGNSGGPLVDASGKLIGINTAIVGDTFRGVSFSIPSNVAKAVYERLRADGRFDRGYLGTQLADVPDELVVGGDLRVRGAMVTGLAGPESPAARGGTKPGDIILRLDDQPIKDVDHLFRVVGNLAIDTPITLDVRRGDETIRLKVTIGARPAELAAR